MSIVKEHFNEIAAGYDKWKEKNWYYYKNLKALYRSLVGDDKVILEVGCGTGDILASLNPKRGTGIDISDEMVKIAAGKHSAMPALQFFAATAEEFQTTENFDFIVIPDVIEHLENVPSTIAALQKFCNAETEIIISMINPLWEPIFMILEKLKLKMPEGPHNRISANELKAIAKKSGFSADEDGYRLIFPMAIPVFSDWLNGVFYKIPLLKNLGALYYIKFVCEKK
jgi:2-polyprenyl-3-methyl-5-hydroxy-6-metoxy-1,4-benzoquinol methylase